jgi:putative FmdB family regulatory protein
MPIYGYVCKNCEHTLDALQKISDDPLVDCPECGEPQLRRQLSAPRFRLKGTGWYETDFKKDRQRNLHGEKEPAKKGDKAAAKKPDKSDAGPATDNKSGVG